MTGNRRAVVRRVGLRLLCVLGLLTAASGTYATYSWAGGNFHVVKPGSLYRSAQPTPEDLAEWKARYGIATVINLRGAHPGTGWYDAERKAAADLGVRLVDYPISAKHQLTADQVDEILDILRSLDGPTLIHCMSGVDRTGIVSAFYLAEVAKAGEMTAELQLSLFYGHIPLPISPFYAMDLSFEAAEPMFGYVGS